MFRWIPQATSWSKSSLHGIRVYTDGSILAPHVDRDFLISAAKINVAQNVDELRGRWKSTIILATLATLRWNLGI